MRWNLSSPLTQLLVPGCSSTQKYLGLKTLSVPIIFIFSKCIFVIRNSCVKNPCPILLPAVGHSAGERQFVPQQLGQLSPAPGAQPRHPPALLAFLSGTAHRVRCSFCSFFLGLFMATSNKIKERIFRVKFCINRLPMITPCMPKHT